MTVKELIEKLQELPPDAQVVEDADNYSYDYIPYEFNVRAKSMKSHMIYIEKGDYYIDVYNECSSDIMGSEVCVII